MRRLFFRVFPAVALAMFGAGMDQTTVAAALPAIARDLGDVERISWVVVAYLVATTIAAPVYGRLGDAFGRKRMLLVALAIYAAGALACAVAPSVPALAAGRLLQGFGGGGLISLPVALIAEAVPPRERGRFQGWIAGVFALASAAGPVAGGLLTAAFGWHAVFLMPLPLAAAAAVLVVTRLEAGPGSRAGFAFDWAGLVLFAAFVGPALLALDQVRRMAPEAAVVGLALAAAAGVALALLLRQERRAKDPLLPLDVLGQASIWRANLAAACVSAAFIGCIAFLPIYFTAVRGLGPAGAGLMLLPLAAAAGLGAVLSGAGLKRTGHAMRYAAVGLAGSALLLAGLAAGAGALPLPALAVLLALVSVGFGASFPMVQVTVQTAAGRDRLGSATASVQFTRALGSAVGTAALGTVLFAALALSGPEVAARFVAVVQTGPEALAGLAPSEAADLRAAMAGGFRALLLAAALLTGLGAWMCTRVPLQRL